MKAKLTALALLTVLLLTSVIARPGFAQVETPTPYFYMEVTPKSASSSGLPGTIVSYTLTVKNTGNQLLSVSASTAGMAAWVANVNPSSFTLSAGDSKDVSVSVAIAVSAQAGNMEQTTVTFTDTVNNISTNATLTTTASQNPTPVGPGRPMIVLQSYSVGASGAISPGDKFDLRLRVANVGNDYARNIVFTFSGTDFLPLNTGGVVTHNELDPNEKVDIVQSLLASSALVGQKVATTTVAVNYTDLSGQQAYTASFTITVNLSQPSYSGSAAATPTPTQVSRPQLVVSGYGTDVEPLQPGTVFSLNLEIKNLGTSDARSVTMVLGGGVSSGGDSGTPTAGGVSGSGADTSVFAPLGSSNLVYLGDVPVGVTLQSSQKLIVNTTANPGAYSFKISFVYDDAKGVRQVNDQVITLLIYQLPQIEINYYRDPGVFMLGQPNILPLQVTNLGRKTAVLGNMKVTSPNADVTNNVSLVGVLDPGGYFTLDSNVVPMAPGQLTFDIVVNYTDDFNQPRVVNASLVVEVMDMPTPEPFPTDGNPKDGGIPPVTEETTWQKIVRFIKGLFGLGSQQPSTSPGQFIPEGTIYPEKISPENIQPAPVIVKPPKG